VAHACSISALAARPEGERRSCRRRLLHRRKGGGRGAATERGAPPHKRHARHCCCLAMGTAVSSTHAVSTGATRCGGSRSRRIIDEALERIRQDLDALGASSTLLRLANDKFTVTSAGATLAIAVGAGVGRFPVAQATGTPRPGQLYPEVGYTQWCARARASVLRSCSATARPCTQPCA
jgi:hypothetical protein